MGCVGAFDVAKSFLIDVLDTSILQMCCIGAFDVTKSVWTNVLEANNLVRNNKEHGYTCISLDVVSNCHWMYKELWTFNGLYLAPITEMSQNQVHGTIGVNSLVSIILLPRLIISQHYSFSYTVCPLFHNSFVNSMALLRRKHLQTFLKIAKDYSITIVNKSSQKSSKSNKAWDKF